MPKIYITGESQSITVTEDEANTILEQKNNPKYKGMITIQNRKVSKGRIKEVSFGNEKMSLYNLNEPGSRRIILDFEKMLDGLKDGARLDNPIEYYGIPYKNGIVANEILGSTHWTVVQYALNQNIINRFERAGIIYWTIRDHATEHDRHDTGLYDEFYTKLKALDDLQSRRNYAQRQQEKAAIQTAEKETKKVDPNTLTIDDLPFKI